VSKFIIPCLYEAQHVSDDTPPIIRSLKLSADSVQQLHVQTTLHVWKTRGC